MSTRERIHFGGVFGTISLMFFVWIGLQLQEPDIQKISEPIFHSQASLEDALRSVEDLIYIPLEELHAQTKCLADNMYHEARGEGEVGLLAVAFVTRNRVKSDRYPDTVCEVVKQRKMVDGKWKCQFEWFCDGKSDEIRLGDEAQYKKIHILALDFLSWGGNRYLDTTSGSLHYHANTILPFWAKGKLAVAEIKKHLFYNNVR